MTIYFQGEKMKQFLLIVTLAAASMQMGFAQDSLTPYLSSLTPAPENNAANMSAFIQGFGGGYNPSIVFTPTPSTPMAVAPITVASAPIAVTSAVTSAPAQTAASWSLPAAGFVHPTRAASWSLPARTGAPLRLSSNTARIISHVQIKAVPRARAGAALRK
jgi:hypothetical protein